MNLLDVTWRSLGYDHLGMWANLRRAQLHVARPDGRKVAKLDDFVGSVSVEVHEPGVVGLMANAIAARAAGNREEIQSILLARPFSNHVLQVPSWSIAWVSGCVITPSERNHSFPGRSRTGRTRPLTLEIHMKSGQGDVRPGSSGWVKSAAGPGP